VCLWSEVQEGLVTSDIVESGLRRWLGLRRVLRCLAGGQRSMEWVSRCVARCGEGTDCCHGPGTTRTRLIPIKRSSWHLNIPVSEIPINMYLITFESAFSVYDTECFSNAIFWVKRLFSEFKFYFNELWVIRAMAWWLSHEMEMHSKDEVVVHYLGVIPGTCLEQLKRTTIKICLYSPTDT
jgi:hypothetical protein